MSESRKRRFLTFLSFFSSSYETEYECVIDDVWDIHSHLVKRSIEMLNEMYTRTLKC